MVLAPYRKNANQLTCYFDERRRIFSVEMMFPLHREDPWMYSQLSKKFWRLHWFMTVWRKDFMNVLKLLTSILIVVLFIHSLNLDHVVNLRPLDIFISLRDQQLLFASRPFLTPKRFSTISNPKTDFHYDIVTLWFVV